MTLPFIVLEFKFISIHLKIYYKQGWDFNALKHFRNYEEYFLLFRQ